MKKSIGTYIFLFFTFLGFSQEMDIAIWGVYKKSVVKEQLYNAKTIKDINAGYPTSWIGGYNSVEVIASCDGQVKKVVGKSDVLNTEQVRLLKAADFGAKITFKVKYFAKNASEDDINEMTFTYTVVPKVEAVYPDGELALKNYIQNNVLAKLDLSTIQDIEFATVRFTINTDGQVIGARLIDTSGYKNADNLLLKAVSYMKKWQPARSAKGERVKQEFELSIGTMLGC